MAIYESSVVSKNDVDLYKKVRDKRGVKFISQFRTKIFNKIDMSKIPNSSYVWKKGDNLFKLSQRFYNDKKFWWTIAYFNQKPTEAFFEIGETIYIPTRPFYGEL